MISYGQAVVLGLLQGVAEPFPISSLGHAVILPKLLGWNIHQNDKFFLTFLVATHLATAIVLFFFFLKDWVRILSGLGRSLRDVGAHALRDIPIREYVDSGADLFVELMIERVFSEEGVPQADQSRDRTHGQSASRIWPMASATLAHFFFSAASWREPAGVMR